MTVSQRLAGEAHWRLCLPDAGAKASYPQIHTQIKATSFFKGSYTRLGKFHAKIGVCKRIEYSTCEGRRAAPHTCCTQLAHRCGITRVEYALMPFQRLLRPR